MPEVIPELALIVGLFFAVVGYLTARGLLATWTHSLGFVFQWLGAHLRVPIPTGIKTFHVDLGGPFRAVDSWAVTALQNWCDGAEIQMGYCLHGMRKVALYTAQAIDFLSRETTQTLEWITHVRMPKWARWAIAAALPAALIAKLIRAAVAHIAPIIVRSYHAVTHEVTHTFTRVIRYAIPHAIPGAHAIPRIEREIVGLTKRNLRLSKRLHRVESLFGVAAMAAVMANVLGLPNWRCLTRGNVGRLARHVCGLDRWLIDLLLIGSIEAFVATDLCDFSDLLISETQQIRPALMEFVDVENALVGCHGNTAPNVLALPPVSLPALVDAVSLAA